mgnify:CR=1 FL=1
MHNIIQMETSAKLYSLPFGNVKTIYSPAVRGRKHRLAATLPSGPGRRSDVASHLFLHTDSCL